MTSTTLLELVRLPPLMVLTSGRSDVIIGLLDGPVALDHPELTSEHIQGIPGVPATCDLTSQPRFAPLSEQVPVPVEEAAVHPGGAGDGEDADLGGGAVVTRRRRRALSACRPSRIAWVRVLGDAALSL